MRQATYIGLVSRQQETNVHQKVHKTLEAMLDSKMAKMLFANKIAVGLRYSQRSSYKPQSNYQKRNREDL